MATKDNTPSMQSRSATTPTGEESTIPVSQPSGLGELTTSMVTKTDKRLEVIQRAQISSLTGADKIKEPQEKTSKRQLHTLATQNMPWSCGWKLKLVRVCTPPLRKTLTVSILQLTLLTTLIQIVLACTWVWLVTCWPSTVRRLILGPASSMIRLSLPVKPLSIFPLGWDTLLDGGCDA